MHASPSTAREDAAKAQSGEYAKCRAHHPHEILDRDVRHRHIPDEHGKQQPTQAERQHLPDKHESCASWVEPFDSLQVERQQEAHPGRGAVVYESREVREQKDPVDGDCRLPLVTTVLMLTRILADNFRALANFEFRPGNPCLLLGDNGSGKSSLVEVLALTSDLIARGRSTADLFRGTQTRWDTRDAQRFELDVEVEQGAFRYALEIQHPPDRFGPPTIRSEVVVCDGETLYRFADRNVFLQTDRDKTSVNFPFQSSQSYLAHVETRSSRLGWFKAFIEGVSIIQPNPFAMEATSKHDLPVLWRYCQNLASFFAFLNNERPDVRSALETRLREVIPGFRNFVLKRMGEEKLLLVSFGNEHQQTHELGLLDLSEGQRVLIALYAALYGMLSATALLCFDEPDNFVALAEVQPWLQALRDTLDERGGQAIVVSHHPEVIDYLALDSAWRFERPTGPVVARPLDLGSHPGLRPSEIIVRGG